MPLAAVTSVTTTSAPPTVSASASTTRTDPLAVVRSLTRHDVAEQQVPETLGVGQQFCATGGGLEGLDRLVGRGEDRERLLAAERLDEAGLRDELFQP